MNVNNVSLYIRTYLKYKFQLGLPFIPECHLDSEPIVYSSIVFSPCNQPLPVQKAAMNSWEKHWFVSLNYNELKACSYL
jgi:hypothetical protein